MAEIIKFNSSEKIYNEEMILKCKPFSFIIEGITILFNFILIGIILTKTPKSMNNFKLFLLPYACFTLLFEISFAFYSPTLLHPFFFIYPNGFAKDLFPPNLALTNAVFICYFAFSLVDCCSGMVLERYFAMRSKPHSKIPLIIFGILATSSLCFLIFGTIGANIDSMKFVSLKTPNEIENILITHLTSTTSIPVDINYVIGMAGANANEIGFPVICCLIFGLIRVFLIIIVLILNAIKSRKLSASMSLGLQEKNKMLLRVIYAQFFGFAFILGIPIILVFSTFLFFTEPKGHLISFYIFCCTFIALYDPIITVIFIKPYRTVFLNCFKSKKNSLQNAPKTEGSMLQSLDGSTGRTNNGEKANLRYEKRNTI